LLGTLELNVQISVITGSISNGNSDIIVRQSTNAKPKKIVSDDRDSYGSVVHNIRLGIILRF
jgi:hypothetical protein